MTLPVNQIICKQCGKVFDGRKQGFASHDAGFVCGPKCALALNRYERYFKPIRLKPRRA